MHRIESSHRHRKRLLGAGKYVLSQLEEGHALEHPLQQGAVCRPESSPVDTRPGLVGEQPAGNEPFFPDTPRRRSILGQELGQQHRRVDVDQRSSRSSSRSRRSSSQVMTGRPAGSSRVTHRRRGQPSLAHRLRERGIMELLRATLAWSYELGNHLIAIHHQHRLTRGRQPHVLAQPVLELFDAHGAHVHYCSYR